MRPRHPGAHPFGAWRWREVQVPVERLHLGGWGWGFLWGAGVALLLVWAVG